MAISNGEEDRLIRVWVIEDNTKLRHYLAKYLNACSDISCDENFSSCEEAVKAVKEDGSAPDVLIVDIGLPGMTGIEGIRYFKTSLPNTEALVLTVSNEREQVFEAISAGASGYLLKNASIEEIANACRKISIGEASLDGEIARMMLDAFQKPEKKKQIPHNLTSREFEILNLLAEGLYCKEISDQLGVSPSTVNFHCSNLYKKLHVQSQRSAINEAKRRGII